MPAPWYLLLKCSYRYGLQPRPPTKMMPWVKYQILFVIPKV